MTERRWCLACRRPAFRGANGLYPMCECGCVAFTSVDVAALETGVTSWPQTPITVTTVLDADLSESDRALLTALRIERW